MRTALAPVVRQTLKRALSHLKGRGAMKVYPVLLLVVWIVAVAVQFICMGLAAWRVPGSNSRLNSLALTLSAAVAVIPVLALIAFCRVYLFPPDWTQHESRYTLATMRVAEAWQLISYPVLVGFGVSVISAVLMPRPSPGVASFVSRAAGVVSSASAWIALASFDPIIGPEPFA